MLFLCKVSPIYWCWLLIDKLIMRIIIEEHKYAAADVKDVLKGIDALENVEGYVSVNYVGYFYNTDKDVRDCVLK